MHYQSLWHVPRLDKILDESEEDHSHHNQEKEKKYFIQIIEHTVDVSTNSSCSPGN